MGYSHPVSSSHPILHFSSAFVFYSHSILAVVSLIRIKGRTDPGPKLVMDLSRRVILLNCLSPPFVKQTAWVNVQVMRTENALSAENR